MEAASMRRTHAAIGLLALLSLNGCSIVMSESELPGSYQGEDYEVVVTIDLRMDHTYSEKLDLGWEKQEKVEGRWSWDGRALTLTLALIPEVYRSPTRDDWALSPEIRFGRKVLIDYGTDLELKKTK